MPAKPVCPSCGGPTEEGFVAGSLDLTTTPAFWVAGTPTKEWLTKGVSMEGHARRPLVARRCQRCGQVTFVAPEDGK